VDFSRKYCSVAGTRRLYSFLVHPPPYYMKTCLPENQQKWKMEKSGIYFKISIPKYFEQVNFSIRGGGGEQTEGSAV